MFVSAVILSDMSVHMMFAVNAHDCLLSPCHVVISMFVRRLGSRVMIDPRLDLVDWFLDEIPQILIPQF